MLIHLIILNHRGRDRLAESLPSVLQAARMSRHRCDVTVIDDGSRDDLTPWFSEHFPTVHVVRQPNRGPCGYNNVIGSLQGRIAVLLKNDVRLAEDAIDTLVEPLLAEQSDCFMTVPMCRRLDGKDCQVFRTAVRWHWGLIQPTTRFSGDETVMNQAGPTASAGSIMAIDCHKFLELGGFDPLYRTEPVETFDFAYRGFLQGYWACYVPESAACYRDTAPSVAAGPLGLPNPDALVLRDTLLFEWKNVRHPLHVARCLLGLAAWWGLEVATMPWTSPDRRWTLTAALAAAVERYQQNRSALEGNSPADGDSDDLVRRPKGKLRREREFFRRFSPEKMAETTPERNGKTMATRFQSMTARHVVTRANFLPDASPPCRAH